MSSKCHTIKTPGLQASSHQKRSGCKLFQLFCLEAAAMIPCLNEPKNRPRSRFATVKRSATKMPSGNNKMQESHTLAEGGPRPQTPGARACSQCLRAMEVNNAARVPEVSWPPPACFSNGLGGLGTGGRRSVCLLPTFLGRRARRSFQNIMRICVCVCVCVSVSVFMYVCSKSPFAPVLEHRKSGYVAACTTVCRRSGVGLLLEGLLQDGDEAHGCPRTHGDEDVPDKDRCKSSGATIRRLGRCPFASCPPRPLWAVREEKGYVSWVCFVPVRCRLTRGALLVACE